MKHTIHKMFSSLTSWLSGGSESDKGREEANKDNSNQDESKESSNRSPSGGEAAGASWAGERMLKFVYFGEQCYWRCYEHRVDF